MAIFRKIAITLAVLIVIAGGAFWYLSRGDTADLTVEDVAGTDPVLQEGKAEGLPTVQVAEPVGWQPGEAPTPAQGLEVVRFAEGLEHPRTLYTLPNGDVLVGLTRGPKMTSNGGGIMGAITAWVADRLMTKAGATGPSPNQVVLLRDLDGNGTAETKQVILKDGLDSPSGIAWQDGTLYVANHNAVLAFAYELGSDTVTGAPRKLMDLPAGGNHWMRNIILSPDGTKLYVAVGSASNIGENGIEAEKGRAMIWELDLAKGRQRPFGVGLRNPNGLAFSPWSGELWTTVNERDMLGSDLVPDYLTNVPVGAQYGWPWVYYRSNIDRRVTAPMPQFLAEYSRYPVFALGPHVAALGMVFSQEGDRMGTGFAGGAFVARHGSWNRKPPSGYDVVFVDFDARGNPVGKPRPVLTGFLKADGTTRGRPTWVTWGKDGALLVSDDTAGIIWRVRAPSAAPAPAIARLEGERLPARALKDPRAEFEADYLRKQAGQKIN
jgi:glucose/arabinose dehydrogenase